MSVDQKRGKNSLNKKKVHKLMVMYWTSNLNWKSNLNEKQLLTLLILARLIKKQLDLVYSYKIGL